MKRANLLFTIISATLLLVAGLADHVCAQCVLVYEADCEAVEFITWSGRVTDTGGAPVPPGEYTLEYCYYEDSTGDACQIICCTTTTTVIDDGLTSTILTYPQPIYEDMIKRGGLFRAPQPVDMWLEIWFNGELISPRTQVTDVPDAGTAQRLWGDNFTEPGRVLIIDATLDSSGAINMITNDSGSSLALYRTNVAPSPEPGIIMQTTEAGSMAALLDTAGDTAVLLTDEGEGTFEGLIWSKTGFKFPDLTIQTTAWTGGGGCWECPANYTYLADINDSVGIGTTTPSEKLEVTGNLRVTGKATIGPGHTNTGTDAFVAGNNNTASGNYSTVGGGRFNVADTGYSTISGGYNNTASGYTSAVGGGYGNSAYGDRSTVGGGFFNIASGQYSSVGGGYDNTASAHSSAVGGGYSNTASGDMSTVGGGYINIASGNYSSISGGVENAANGNYGTVGGGYRNNASGSSSCVGGGRSDTSKALWGGVFSGYSNMAGDAADDTAAYVGGGYDNSATAPYATVAGGKDNQASYRGSTIGGGENNYVGGNYSTISGGKAGTASGHYSTVSGGELNEASGDVSTVSGGRLNSADGSASTVSGGYRNYNAGDYSVIPGGYRDTLTSNADYSMAFGEYMYVNTSFRVVFFGSASSGRLGINRDDRDGGVLYPIHVGTDGTNGNGAYLTNGGAWTDGSSREFKENFQQLDGQEVLNRIEDLPMESWEYKGTGERHIWPCAEDFHEQFDVGVIKEDGTRDTEYLAAGDVAGVALAGVKELTKENRELRERIEQLEVLVETILAQQSGSKGGSDNLALDK